MSEALALDRPDAAAGCLDVLLAMADELEAFLIAWWVEFADKPPVLQRKMRTNTEAWSAMMLELDTTLDAEQRQSLLDTLDHFIEELGELVPEQTAS